MSTVVDKVIKKQNAVISDLAQFFGLARTTSLNRLVKAGTINKWSRFKPLSYGRHPQPLTGTERDAARNGFTFSSVDPLVLRSAERKWLSAHTVLSSNDSVRISDFVNPDAGGDMEGYHHIMDSPLQIRWENTVIDTRNPDSPFVALLFFNFSESSRNGVTRTWSPAYGLKVESIMGALMIDTPYVTLMFYNNNDYWLVSLSQRASWFCNGLNSGVCIFLLDFTAPSLAEIASAVADSDMYCLACLSAAGDSNNTSGNETLVVYKNVAYSLTSLSTGGVWSDGTPESDRIKVNSNAAGLPSSIFSVSFNANSLSFVGTQQKAGQNLRKYNFVNDIDLTLTPNDYTFGGYVKVRIVLYNPYGFVGRYENGVTEILDIGQVEIYNEVFRTPGIGQTVTRHIAYPYTWVICNFASVPYPSCTLRVYIAGESAPKLEQTITGNYA